MLQSEGLFELQSGYHVDMLDPDPARINIKDIALSLSRQCRYLGHSKCFYTVAQHSILMANYGRDFQSWGPLMQLAGLLHDAAEAYLGDSICLTKPREFYLLSDPEAEEDVYVQKRMREGQILHAINTALCPHFLPFMEVAEMHEIITLAELKYVQGWRTKNAKHSAAIKSMNANNEFTEQNMNVVEVLFLSKYDQLIEELAAYKVINNHKVS